MKWIHGYLFPVVVHVLELYFKIDKNKREKNPIFIDITVIGTLYKLPSIAKSF